MSNSINWSRYSSLTFYNRQIFLNDFSFSIHPRPMLHLKFTLHRKGGPCSSREQVSVVYIPFPWLDHLTLVGVASPAITNGSRPSILGVPSQGYYHMHCQIFRECSFYGCFFTMWVKDAYVAFVSDLVVIYISFVLSMWCYLILQWDFGCQSVGYWYFHVVLKWDFVSHMYCPWNFRCLCKSYSFRVGCYPWQFLSEEL